MSPYFSPRGLGQLTAIIVVFASQRLVCPRGAHSRPLVKALILLLLLTVPLISSVSAQPQTERVVILTGYDPSYPGFSIVNQNIMATIRNGSTVRTEFYYEFQEDSRISNSKYEKEMVSYLQRKYDGENITLVIAIGGSALKFLLDHESEVFNGVPKTYYFHDQPEEKARQLWPRVTGVWAKLDLARTLDVALSLHPDTESVVVVSGSSDEDRSLRAQVQNEFRRYEDRVRFRYVDDLTMDELKTRLAGLPPKTIVFYIAFFRDKKGNSYNGPEALSMFAPTTNAPIYGVSGTYLGAGIVGGSLLDFAALGRAIGNVGLRLKAGEKPESIPPQTAPPATMFDARQLKRWNVDQRKLPPNSIVQFGTPAFWAQYKWYVMAAAAGFAIQTVLIIGLLIMRSRRRQSEERNRAILEAIPDLMFVQTREGVYLDCAAKDHKDLVVPVDAFLGKNMRDVLPPDLSEQLVAAFSRLEAGQPEIVEYELDLNGTHRWFEARLVLTDSNVLSVVRDVTSRKLAEIAVKKNEAQLSGIIGTAMDSIITIDEDQRIVLFNAAAEKLFGCSAVDALGQSVDRFIPERFREIHRQHVREFGKTQTTRRGLGMPGNLFGIRASGEEFPIEASISKIDLSGQTFYTVILRDIAERVAAERALQESEERFRNMADSAPVMIWVSGEDKQCTYCNKQWLEFTGRSLDQEIGVGWADSIHPDDYDRCLETFQRGSDDRKAFALEYRLRRKDGEFRWVYDTGTPRFSADHTFLGYIGSCNDITERKEAEVALRKGHDELRHLKEQLEAENIYLQEELQSDRTFGEIVGESDALKAVVFKIRQVAPTESTVLIAGETGTGKELVARAIHSASSRKDRPLIKVDCGALSPNLIESELFGHEKGSFTGAVARKVGRFELANGGTIFLDEIGELPLELQVKLLRVIQEKEFERLGGTKTLKADVRIIAATNRNLRKEVESKTFREDLWYRLNVFPITVPPLRERKEDIPVLVDHFLKRYAKKAGKTITAVSAKAMHSLQVHSWPGNVRELANVIERAVIHTQGSVLKIADHFEREAVDEPSSSLKTLEELEREYITRILDDIGWRIEGPYGAARILGLNPSTLRTRMLKLGIQRQSVAARSRN